MTLPPTEPHQYYCAPALAVCGFSGSGKTTLLEGAIRQLTGFGLAVAVIKHDAHGVVVDTPGKDSDRLFEAGATVALRAPNQQFLRRHENSSLSLHATLAELARDHDLLLVEGHKDTPLPKFWLEDAARTSVPGSVSNIVATLPWDGERLAKFLDYVSQWLPRAWRERRLFCGMLTGGKSSRMGLPKQLLKFGDKQLGEIVADALRAGNGGSDALILGSEPTPASLSDLIRLPDAPGFAGPCAGLIAGHRWAPHYAWIVSACDHPWLRAENIEWLTSLRRPGTWSIIPTQEDGHPSTTLALYEPQALFQLERNAREEGQNARIAVLIDHPRTLIVDPPQSQKKAWRNVNTPEDLRTAGSPFWRPESSGKSEG